MPDALTIAQTCAKYANEIQAENVVILDLKGISTITDYFVICTGTSTPHLNAIRRDVRDKTAEEIKEQPRSIEGDSGSRWLVIDYVDVIVHIFHSDMRSVYALEDLWSDAPRVEMDSLEKAGA